MPDPVPAATDNNPFAAPTTGETVVSEGRDFARLDFKQVKKIYHRSINIGTIGVLVLIGGAFSCSLPLWVPPEVDLLVPHLVFPVIGLFQIVAGVGCFTRQGWARATCIIACILMMTGGSLLAIIIGIAGIVGCARSPELFGADRVTHAAIKAEFKRRKAAGKR
ncbi:MAG TPA: hypothetical protein VEL07_03145 [Planctomycetota bacterium]|nr:hypothetical protein [Planctomycetota bacterium]